MGNFICYEEDNFQELNKLIKYKIKLINEKKKLKELNEKKELEWYNNEEKFRTYKWNELFDNKGMGTTVFELDSYYHQNIDKEWESFKRYFEKKNNILK
jgi:hypothetical protein